MRSRAPSSAVRVAALPKGVAAALQGEHGDLRGEQLVEARDLGPSGRVQREGEADDRCGRGRPCGAAGDAGAGATAADDQRRSRRELGDHRCGLTPGGVKGRGAAGDPPRLLVADDGDPPPREACCERGEVDGVDPATRAVAEPEHCCRALG